jgi:hypothetical protein
MKIRLVYILQKISYTMKNKLCMQVEKKNLFSLVESINQTKL